MQFVQAAAVVVSFAVHHREFGLRGGISPGWRRDALKIEVGSGVLVIVIFDHDFNVRERGRCGD